MRSRRDEERHSTYHSRFGAAAIAVFSSLVTYTWVTSYTESLSRTAEPIQPSEVLRIEGASYSDGRLQVIVRNMGSRRNTVAAIHVLGQERSAAYARTDLTVNLETGNTAIFEVEGAQLGFLHREARD